MFWAIVGKILLSIVAAVLILVGLIFTFGYDSDSCWIAVDIDAFDFEWVNSVIFGEIPLLAAGFCLPFVIYQWSGFRIWLIISTIFPIVLLIAFTLIRILIRNCLGDKSPVSIVLLILGIVGVNLVVYLWWKNWNISARILPFSIIPIIVLAIWHNRQKEDSLKKPFTTETIKNLSEELLKNAYYFLDTELKMTRVETSSEKTSESGKMVLKSSSLENQIIITENTKGKLLSIDNDVIRIQFDADEECSLFFRNIGKYELKTDDGKVIYNKNEYLVDQHPHVLFKLVKISSSKTIKNKAKGAW